MWKHIEAQLVEDWNQAHKWLSMWGLAAIFVAPDVYDYVSSAVAQLGHMPPYFSAVLKALAVLSAVGRLYKQRNPDAKSPLG